MTAQEAKELDEYVRKYLGIQSLVLMENAGRAVAEVVLDSIGKDSLGRIAVFCGKGNNAGDGFVAARHLIVYGKEVDVYLLAPPQQIKNEAGINLNILKKISSRIFEIKDSASLESLNLKDYTIIVDALLGIGLEGEIKGIFKEAISKINESKIPTIAVDIPSGLDATTGKIHGIAVRAVATVTFMAKKKGLLIEQGPSCCGRIIVKDIGIPVKNLLEK